MIKIFFLLAFVVFQIFSHENSIEIPLWGIDRVIASENILDRGIDSALGKALLVQSIDRRNFAEGKITSSYGTADWSVGKKLYNQLSKVSGGIVEGVLNPDEVKFIHYDVVDDASFSATIAWLEDRGTNLRFRVSRDRFAGSIRPWGIDKSGALSRNVLYNDLSVKRVDTEVRKGDKVVIKISAMEKLSKPAPFSLVVKGAIFSDIELSRDLFMRRLSDENRARKLRIENFILSTDAAVDSVLPDGSKWHMVDIENGKPVYYTVFNLNAAISSKVKTLWPGGETGLNLSGSTLERSLGIWDEGAVRTTHREFGGRVTLGDNVAAASHSTHVGGTMIAAGVDPKAKGMAFEAELKSYDWNSDENEMASEAGKGLLVSQHSYGIPGDYTYSNQWDQLANQYPMYTISKSAANEGKFKSVTRNGNAKNIITVGSAQDRSANWNGPSTNSAMLSSFTSKGPAPDGRIKPDIVANGQQLYSTSYTGDDKYESKSGTSMAGPSNAGSIALLQEYYYKTHNETYMSAATLKALVIETADEIDADGPDYSSGWGYINMKKATERIAADQGGKAGIIQTLTIKNGETINLKATHNVGEDVSVTIVWNDPAPSSNSGNALVNDLDLRVTADATEHLPWMMPWSGSNHDVKAQRGDNSLDNVEKVQISGVSGSDIGIKISHKGSLKNGSQEFSIVLSGVSINTDPFVAVNYPNGGEELEQFTTQEISWSSNIDEPVDIVLLKGGKIIDTLASETTNSGKFSWVVPDTLSVGSDYKIKIVPITSTDKADESDENFSIVPEYIISEFPFVEPFEDYTAEGYDIGRWEQNRSDDEIDWMVFKGVTPTGQYGIDAGGDPGTGPIGDHTSGNGNYVYVEASYNYADNKRAFISSPKMDIHNLSNPTLSYWLQMYAQDGKMGSVEVDILSDGKLNKNVKKYSGSQGKDWFSDTLDLSAYKGKRVQVVFRGTVGDSFYSDMCLDDFRVGGVVFPSFTDLSDVDAKEGIEFEHRLNISKVTRDLVFDLAKAPSWLTIKSQDSSGLILSGTPKEGDSGDEKIVIQTVLGSVAKFDTLVVHIMENSAPVFITSPDSLVILGSSYKYEITIEDADSENTLTIFSGNLPSWLSFSNVGLGKAILSGTPEPKDTGDYAIELLADDGVVSTKVSQLYTLTVDKGTGIALWGEKIIRDGVYALPSKFVSGEECSFYISGLESGLMYRTAILDDIGNSISVQSGITSKDNHGDMVLCGKWNGLNSMGRYVASGSYCVIISVKSKKGLLKYYKLFVNVIK